MKRIVFDKYACAMISRKLLDKGVPLSELSKIAGLTDVEVKGIENGKTSLSLSKVHNLAVLTGMPISELFLEIDKTPLNKTRKSVSRRD